MLQFPGGQAGTVDAFPDLPSSSGVLATTAALLGPSAQAAGVLISGYNNLFDLQLMLRDPQGGGAIGFKYGPIIYGLYPGGFVFPAAIGFRCRNHNTGQVAQIIGQVWDLQDGPLPQTPLSPNVQTLTPGGGIITPGGSSTFTVATALPAGPATGQQVVLTDSLTVPTYSWLLQYDVTSNVWRFLGGNWLEGTTTLTIPRDGSYYCAIGFAGAGYGANSNVQLGLTAGGITLNAWAGNNGGGTQGTSNSGYDEGRMTGLTTGQVLTPANAGNVGMTRQFIRVLPVFLGVT